MREGAVSAGGFHSIKVLQPIKSLLARTQALLAHQKTVRKLPQEGQA